MSLDVYLEGEQYETICTCCGNTYMQATVLYSANITHNLGRMASEAGVYKCLWRPDGLSAAELIEPLENGLAVLKSDPVRFKVFNPENGWGSYADLVKFVECYLGACKMYPNSIVRVSR